MLGWTTSWWPSSKPNIFWKNDCYSKRSQDAKRDALHCACLSCHNLGHFYAFWWRRKLLRLPLLDLTLLVLCVSHLTRAEHWAFYFQKLQTINICKLQKGVWHLRLRIHRWTRQKCWQNKHCNANFTSYVLHIVQHCDANRKGWSLCW